MSDEQEQETDTGTKDEAAVPLNAEQSQDQSTHTCTGMEEGRRPNKQLPRMVYWAILLSMVLISTVVISLNGKLI